MDLEFDARGEVFAGPQLLKALEDAVRHGDEELRTSLRQHKFPRLGDARTVVGGMKGCGTVAPRPDVGAAGTEIGRVACASLPLSVGSPEGLFTLGGALAVPREEPSGKTFLALIK